MSDPFSTNIKSRISSESSDQTKQPFPNTEDNSRGIQIFLGGSCNPTTWRQNIAIPYLESNGISYYNPQIDNWTPEVVDIERHAKQNANCLLFVIDTQTRSTVSLVESAYMAGADKRLVLVIYPFECSIDHLSIQSGSKLMSNVIESHEETRTTSRLLHASSSVQSTSLSVSSSSSKSMTTSSSNYTSGTIRVNGESISLGEFHELRQARYILQSLVLRQGIPIFSDIPQALEYVSKGLKTSVRPDLDSSGFSSDAKASLKDVYLSLDDNDGNFSVDEVVSPLEEKGLTFDYKPLRYMISTSGQLNSSISTSKSVSQLLNDLGHSDNSSSDETERKLISNSRLALEKEYDAVKRSRVILFVITNKCRGLSIMVLASHFMALFRQNVVLCIQYLKEPCTINGESLSKNAISDYNRGRVYLCDYALETKVPVFSTIREAVDCCSQRCGYTDTNSLKSVST